MLPFVFLAPRVGRSTMALYTKPAGLDQTKLHPDSLASFWSCDHFRMLGRVSAQPERKRESQVRGRLRQKDGWLKDNVDNTAAESTQEVRESQCLA